MSNPFFRVRLAGQSNWIPLADDSPHQSPTILEAAIELASHLYGASWCELTNGTESAMQGNKGVVRSTDNPNVKRYDVNASVHDAVGGSDGAYDLHGRSMTPAEIAERLKACLEADWGLWQGSAPFRLEIHIGPAGTGDDLPL